MTEAGAPESVPPVSAPKKTFAVLWSLAVLVAVLGCLGAIATPKFITFGCKTLQSEPKTNLSGLFNAERAFHNAYGFYTTDLVSLGWAPDGSPRYAYGFVSSSAPASDGRIPALDSSRRTTLDPRVVRGAYSVSKTKSSAGHVFTNEDLQKAVPAATATSNAFLAFAIGDLDADGTFDVWTINERKSLTAVSNDCVN